MVRDELLAINCAGRIDATPYPQCAPDITQLTFLIKELYEIYTVYELRTFFSYNGQLVNQQPFPVKILAFNSYANLIKFDEKNMRKEIARIFLCF